MAFTKHGDTSQVEVLSPQEQDRIWAGLAKLGKTKLADCTEEEKQDIFWRSNPPQA